jgi:hypothetical protein
MPVLVLGASADGGDGDTVVMGLVLMRVPSVRLHCTCCASGALALCLWLHLRLLCDPNPDPYPDPNYDPYPDPDAMIISSR